MKFTIVDAAYQPVCGTESFAYRVCVDEGAPESFGELVEIDDGISVITVDNDIRQQIGEYISIVLGRIICVDNIAVVVQKSSKGIVNTGNLTALVDKVERYAAGYVMARL